jgi:predicted O-linked N-acetylglucosamine transferase (SPINDLY family)
VTLQELLAQALKDHQNGQFDRAERSYRTVLGKNPKHGDALNLLGMLLAQTGRDEEGAELMRRAIAIAPNFAPLHANLGETYRRQKKFDLALAALKRAIALDPRFPEAHNNLAATLGDMARWDESLAAAQRAIALRPGFAGAEFNFGNSLAGVGRHEEAIGAFQRALAAQPGYADALINLGTALQNARRIDEAIAAFAEATRLKPDSADAFNNLAVVLEERGRSDEAMAAYATAVKLNPHNTHAKSNLGFALAKIGRLDEAMELCQSAASSADATADTLVHLGFVYREKQNLAEALKCNLRAIERHPGCAAAHNAIGNIYKDMGQIKEAIASFRRAVELKPEEVGYFSNLVYTLNFDADCSPAQLLAEHKAWAARHCYPYRKLMKPHTNGRDSERRIRIGYVSPDFRMHPVGRFILPLLSGHDHSKFEVYCYASVKKPDSVTDRMRACADVWRNVRGISNIELSEIVRRDQIDILVDLTMHMADNRLTLFAYKPAPVQVTYLAYAGTTGMDTIDYRVTDPWLDPVETADDVYTEKSVRPGISYWCYEAPLENLPLTPPPLLRNGHVTFGCLNNFCKISKQVAETWCRILNAVPNSRLMIHAQLGAHRQRVREIVSACGVDANRLSFVEALPLAEYMAEYGDIDIALDPFPYVGGTTTCDAMWMGVPVVTLCGETAISRGGVTIMRNTGLPELVAQSADEYVRIAVELANDRPRLEAMRNALRDQMKRSPLMDAKRFVGDTEVAFRQMWQMYCSQAAAVELNNSGIVLGKKGDFVAAEASFRKAIALHPGLPQAHYNLGHALVDTGNLDEALTEFRRTIELDPDLISAYDCLAYVPYFHPDYDPKRIRDECRRWSQRFEKPLAATIRPHENDRSPERRLRVGYVSPDFREHAVGRFLLPLLQRHDRARFEIFAYSSVISPDHVTSQMQKLVDYWRDVKNVSDEELAQIVRADRIDILVDLTMHMMGNRLPVFARKPAPVQVTYLAYAGTTGLNTIDYRLTDSWLDPVEAPQDVYSEKSLRLAQSYWCYHPPVDELENTPLPSDRNGFLTFGCLNNFTKVNDQVIDLWADVMNRVANSRLILHAWPGKHRERVRRAFESRRVAAERIEFSGMLPIRDYFAVYKHVDIALDPFPYVGGTTTCDAMWMGVPVVTLGGQTAISRGGVSIMRNVGLPELVTFSTEEYSRLAVELALDRARLAKLRSTLRARMQASSLMDAQRFTRDVEAAYQEMWCRWCAGVEEQAELPLAMEHLQENRPQKAEEILRALLAKEPQNTDLMRLLGVALSMTEKSDEGIALLSSAAQINPREAVIRINLGWALHKSGRFDEAIAEYRQAVRLRPDSPDAQYNLGFALASRRRLDEAIAPLREAFRLQPRHAQAAVDLCSVMRELGRVDEAVPFAREAVRVNPQSAEAQNNLGIILGELVQPEESAAALREAVRLKPDWAIARFNLGRTLVDLAELDEAISCYRRAIDLKPDMLEAYTGLAFTTHYHPDFDAAKILEECRRCSQVFELPLRNEINPHLNDRNPARRLRVGYVSPDFREHPAGRFVLPLLEHHDHRQFEIYGYSNGKQSDQLTDRLRKSCDHWREIRNLSDDEAAKLIRRDGIDILIDLSMYMTDNRILVFARKPAPVQATWLAYPGTTGMRAMDYRITDPWLDPPGTEQFYSERTIRLRDTYWCFQPMAEEIDPGPPPMVKNHFVTFGNLNNFCKVSKPTLELWARVLDRVKDSRLLMLSPAGNHRQRIRQFFAERNIDPARIEFVGFQQRQKYLETYRRIDIGLDTLPYNGHTTSFDSMWMGVPVISRVGQTLVGRAGWSLLSNLGLRELAGETDDGFVRIAEELARNRERLQELRRTLRGRMMASPLMDAPRFARSMEEAYREMWGAWCAWGEMSVEDYNRLGEILRADQPYEGEMGDAAGGTAHLDAAIMAFERATRLKPELAAAHHNLGQALKDAGRMHEAITCFRRAVELNPESAEGYHALAFAAHFHPNYDSASILAQTRRWSERFEASPPPRQPNVKDRSPDRRLRIGYIGNTFCQHCISLFTVPLLSNHDRQNFEIFCYSDVENADRVTERIRTMADHWRPIFGQSDEIVASQIERDEIDLLIDTMMHMPGGRLGVFTHRPAPVQATWIAYPGTTGMKSMDYRLTDPWLDPPGCDEPYTEKTVRLPDTFWCYDPMCEEIDPGPLPMITNGFVTFGNLNNFCKVSKPGLELWARAMHEVKNSRLLLLAPRGNHRDHVRAFFGARKIDPARVEFIDFQPRRKYLEVYRRIDLGIDTLPYNGHTTSLDSMWMGVPVVTRIGWTVVGRAGFSQLSNIGLTELAAETDDGFVRTAVELAQNRPKLQELRSGLRLKMKASPLMDAKRFARGMEDAILRMWRKSQDETLG